MTRFYVRMHNGLTLERSVRNPESNLAKIAAFLRVVGYARRSDIQYYVFGIRPGGFSRGKVTHRLGDSVRNWGSGLFSAAQKAGLIQPIRSGRFVKYQLTTLGKTVIVRNKELESHWQASMGAAVALTYDLPPQSVSVVNLDVCTKDWD